MTSLFLARLALFTTAFMVLTDATAVLSHEAWSLCWYRLFLLKSLLQALPSRKYQTCSSFKLCAICSLLLTAINCLLRNRPAFPSPEVREINKEAVSVLKVSLHLLREIQSRGPSNPTRAKGWAAGRSVPQSPLICSVCIPRLIKGRKIFIAVSDQAGSRKLGRVFGKHIKGSKEQGWPGTPSPEGHRAKGEEPGEQISSGSLLPYLLPFQDQPFPVFQS